MTDSVFPSTGCILYFWGKPHRGATPLDALLHGYKAQKLFGIKIGWRVMVGWHEHLSDLVADPVLITDSYL